MKEKATGFRVLVRPLQVAGKTSSGIITGTETEIEVQQRANDVGTVVDIGPAAFRLERFGNEAPIKIGDTIRFKQYAGHIFRLKDELGKPVSDWYQVINDDDVLTIIEESANG